jgi:hypothetical protein
MERIEIMDRRQFFKSSALWLAGLIVAPHLKLSQAVALAKTRQAVLVIDKLIVNQSPNGIWSMVFHLEQFGDYFYEH